MFVISRYVFEIVSCENKCFNVCRSSEPGDQGAPVVYREGRAGRAAPHHPPRVSARLLPVGGVCVHEGGQPAAGGAHWGRGSAPVGVTQI